MSGDWLDVAGALIGLAAATMGLAALVEDLRHAPMIQRALSAALILLCVDVAIDGVLAARDSTLQAQPLGVAFAAVLGGSWWYRARAGVAKRKTNSREIRT